MVVSRFRKPNFFERVLLVLGIIVVIVGYFLIQKMVSVGGGLLSWDSVQSLFLWLMVILLVIVLAANEALKEELKTVQKNQTEELGLIRKELKMMGKSRTRKRKR
ncbi:hypothetical protein KY336_04760 [Candidatus Woesearchaeota archaeon]|nr:hypothetical protein [Candidatus Woesearchaeota archaeon]